MKISCCMLVFNDEETIDMALESALTFSDEIILVEGGSTDLTVNMIEQFQKKYPNKIQLVDGPAYNPKAYEKQLKDRYGRVMQNGHFGMMKQIAVDHAKGDWIFWLDADEALSDNARLTIDQYIKENPKVDAWDLEHMHFVRDFSNIDNSEAVHIGLLRFHKKLDSLHFTRYNHCLPQGKFKLRAAMFGTLYIFHLGYARNLLDNWKRYKRNMLFSEMHFGVNQCFWRDWHYYNFPTRTCPIPAKNFPEAIKRRFDIGIYDKERAAK